LQRFDSRGAFGEATAAGLFDAGQSVGAIEQERQRRQEEDDDAVVKERISDYRGFSRQRRFEDEDAYMARQGRDAYDSLQTMQDELEAKSKELVKDLTPEQAKKFNVLSRQYLDRDFEGMARHAQGGRVAWLNEQDEVQIKSAQQDGALTGDDVYASQVKKVIGNIATRNGWSPEMRESREMQELSVLHASRIDNLLVDNPGAAATYFAEHRDEILPSIHDDVTRKIEGQQNAVQAQTVADTIRIGGGSRTDRLAQVREIEDPAVRKLVQSQVEHDLQQEKLAEQEFVSDSYDEAAKAVMSGVAATQWAQQNPDKWSALPAKFQQDLLQGKARQFDQVAYAEMSMTFRQDRDEAREYLFSNAHRFTDADFKSWVDRLDKPDSVKSFLNLGARVDVAAEDLSDTEKADLEVAMQEEYVAFQRQHDRVPSPEEEDAIVARLMEKTLDKWYAPTEYRFEDSMNERIVARITEALDAQIDIYRTQFGREPTEQDIADMERLIRERGLY
jgi:hypothetical protein